MYNVNLIIYNEFNKQYSDVNSRVNAFFVFLFEELTLYVNIRRKYSVSRSRIFAIYIAFQLHLR